jgi:hypothetical protein
MVTLVSGTTDWIAKVGTIPQFPQPRQPCQGCGGGGLWGGGGGWAETTPIGTAMAHMIISAARIKMIFFMRFSLSNKKELFPEIGLRGYTYNDTTALKVPAYLQVTLSFTIIQIFH